ncbi:MAG TPA: hypothetical protein VFK02_10380 [Kofleriaceae bacterium]|nr:hypothetical protein [Kofleriaceae bacterium]
MQVVILERNKLVGRKVARWFTATGATTTTIEDPTALPAALAAADVVCADTFDGDVVADSVRARPGLRGVLWTAEPLRRSLRYLVETAAIDHVLARRDFESPPRAWEVTMIARRLQGVPAPPLGAYLDWGFTALDLDVRATADRDAAGAAIQDFVAALAVPRRVAEMFAELGHELIMNAMYDAPIDAFGRVKYAGDRKAEIVLADHERPVVRIATDGTRLALQIRDPFGRLERRHVFDGLARGLAGSGAEMDRTRGGAGLGMMVCHNASSALFFDVVPNRHTEVTALLELDLNLREFRTQARSLHFWRH